MRTLPEPSVDQIDVTEVLRALADPVRLQMLAILADCDEHTCAAREYDLDVHKSTLTHHLAVLRQSGVTTTRVEGRHRYVRLRRKDLDSRFPGLLDAVLGAAPTPRRTAT